MWIKKQTQINATPEKVWQVISDSHYTRKYMFGCEIITNWEKGGPFNWRGHTPDGKEMDFVKGELLEFDRPKLLKISMIDPFGDYPDQPENYLVLTYTIAEGSDSFTSLQLEQGNFASVAKGEQRYQDSLSGWDQVLPMIKKLSEEE